MLRPYLVLLLALAAAAHAAPATPPATTLLAAATAADITPDPGLLNWTLQPPRPYGEVHDPLYARAIVLSDGSTKLALLSWDLLDAREHAVQRVRQAIAAATDIPAAHVIVQASHNHSGPKSEMDLKAPQLPREARTSQPSQENPAYHAWADRLLATSVDLVRRANANLQPASLHLARAYAGDWMFNRRPVRPDQSVLTMMLPADPHVLGQGLRFGTVDPTLTLLSLRRPNGERICTYFHVPIHAVSVYGSYKGLSADWPGPLATHLQGKLGGVAAFLQGCAGDIVPARRGLDAVAAMTEALAPRVLAADRVAVALPSGPLRVASATVAAPAIEAIRQAIGQATLACEVMVVTCGPLALVTLPGEPLQELATAIQQRSPFPHTLVLGYANGRGVGYVGLPGGKAKGGYEMSDVGTGTDEAGQLLVETAVRLLHTTDSGHAPRARP